MNTYASTTRYNETERQQRQQQATDALGVVAPGDVLLWRSSGSGSRAGDCGAAASEGATESFGDAVLNAAESAGDFALDAAGQVMDVASQAIGSLIDGI
ncbi:hypothetical protein AGMMS49545_22280 [Betaproteobacteria bacterium]|nr:hypothetical protein AGMMS49545_22280 [Betaproteobacteria bacterium]GHU39925.1 hypothetical protein AGMMS50289_00590 [Betaproteobacteria bacterium]